MRKPLGCWLLAVLGMVFAVSPAQAQTVQRLIESCRDRIGRPLVEDCLAARGKTADFDACREEASPQVRGCVQDRMADIPARLSRQVAIAHCRQSVGRGIVDACMQKRGVSADLGSCRRKAVSNVRACVRSGMIASFGRARVDRAIQYCRITVGRPLVKSCMRGGMGMANLQSCREKASPTVRACVRKRL